MHMIRRSISRAGALALAAAAFAACSDSTSPLQPDDLETAAEAIAVEIESAVMQLTANGAMDGVESSPSFSIQSQLGQRMVGGASFSLQRAGQIGTQECGVPSENPPTDSDADQVPDNLTITFALPACSHTDENGTVEITGVARMSDPTPGTAGMALSFGLDNFRLMFSGAEGSFTVNRDGSATVSASETGLSQSQDWTESVNFDGMRFGATLDWTSTFAAAAGQVIAAGQPLPNGTYTPNGTFRYSQGNRASMLSVTTVEALAYDAECAAGWAEGMVDSPFASGQVNVAFSGAEGSGFVRITYAACGLATVTYIAAN